MIINKDYVIAETPEEAEQLQLGHIRKEDQYIVRAYWVDGERDRWSTWGTDIPTTIHANHMRNVGGYVVRRPRYMIPAHLIQTEAIHFI